eukprot:PITA_06957
MKRLLMAAMVNGGHNHQRGKFHFVLIHGAGHGARCWYKLIHLLQNSGHKVTAMDLTGSGLNTVDPDSITSFEDYNRPLMNILSEIPHSQVVLVGHGAGGLSLTHAIHVFGHKIVVAVYVAATMLSHGFRTNLDVQLGTPALLNEYEFYHGLGSEHPPGAMVRRELQQGILYQLSPPEDAALASLLIRPTSLLAIQTAKFTATSEEFMKVPRVYIKTLQDRVLQLDKQEAMIKMWLPDKVIIMDTDHSPFFSSPLELHGHLLRIVQLFAG